MDEPRRHRGFYALLTIAAVLSAPFPFVLSSTRLLLGLPLWLWWSAACTTLLSALTAWGVTFYWRDDRFD